MSLGRLYSNWYQSWGWIIISAIGIIGAAYFSLQGILPLLLFIIFIICLCLLAIQ